MTIKSKVAFECALKVNSDSVVYSRVWTVYIIVHADVHTRELCTIVWKLRQVILFIDNVPI